MQLTIQYVERKFEEFNRLIFGGRLPGLKVRLSDAATFLGMCVAKVRLLPDGRKQHYDFELRISRRLDLAEREFEDVIIHEMIHYFIMHNELADTSPHGEIFKGMMKAINRSHGRHITVSRRMSAEERVKSAEAKKVWHVIARITMSDGRSGVKVLPRVIPKILDYYNVIGNSPEVASVELFLSDNPFFNRYPVSAAYKIHAVEEKDMMENLARAARLLVENGKLIQR